MKQRKSRLPVDRESLDRDFLTPSHSAEMSLEHWGRLQREYVIPKRVVDKIGEKATALQKSMQRSVPDQIRIATEELKKSMSELWKWPHSKLERRETKSKPRH